MLLAEHARLIARRPERQQIHPNASANALATVAPPNTASVVRDCRAADLPPARRRARVRRAHAALARDLAMQRMMGGWAAGSRRGRHRHSRDGACTSTPPGGGGRLARPSRYVGAPRAADLSARPPAPAAGAARPHDLERAPPRPIAGAGAGAGGDAAAGEPLPEARCRWRSSTG